MGIFWNNPISRIAGDKLLVLNLFWLCFLCYLSKFKNFSDRKISGIFDYLKNTQMKYFNIRMPSILGFNIQNFENTEQNKTINIKRNFKYFTINNKFCEFSGKFLIGNLPFRNNRVSRKCKLGVDD